jgi:drug/metabolite transporter (DMT)-like permease
LADIPGYAIASLTLGLIALPCWAYVFSSGLPQLVFTHPDGMRGLLATVLLALAGTALALALFNRLIAMTSAVVAASVTYIIPIFAAFWGWLDGEALTWTHLLCGSVILIGVWATRKGG